MAPRRSSRRAALNRSFHPLSRVSLEVPYGDRVADTVGNFALYAPQRCYLQRVAYFLLSSVLLSCSSFKQLIKGKVEGTHNSVVGALFDFAFPSGSTCSLKYTHRANKQETWSRHLTHSVPG